MRFWVHALCIVGGIAAPVAVTMWTTSSSGARSSAHYAKIDKEAAIAEADNPLTATKAPPPLVPSSPPQTEAERKAFAPGDTSPEAVVDAFDQLAFFDRKPVEAMKKYLSPDFVEHSPDFAMDGYPNDKDAAIAIFEKRGWKPDEHMKDDIYKVIADRDYAVVFHHVTPKPGSAGIAYVDIFRISGGLIVEHWAVGEPVPANVSARHSMF